MSAEPKNLKQALDDIRGDLSPLRKDGNLYDELVDLRTDERRAGMSKHTPGPWFSLGAGGTDYTVIASNKGEEVVGVSEWIRAEDEDLRLMATAPELLEALESLLAQVEQYGHKPECDAARAVIAKAKGEQG